MGIGQMGTVQMGTLQMGTGRIVLYAPAKSSENHYYSMLELSLMLLQVLRQKMRVTFMHYPMIVMLSQGMVVAEIAHISGM